MMTRSRNKREGRYIGRSGRVYFRSGGPISVTVHPTASALMTGATVYVDGKPIGTVTKVTMGPRQP